MNAQNNRQSWDEFVRLSAGGPAPRSGQVALVPGAAVPILTLDLPQGLHGQAREKIAMRQLRDRAGLNEEQIDMRPLAQGRGREAWNRALVADPGQLAEWRQAAGPACRAVLPDYLALPTSTGLWTVAQSPDGVQARLGPEDGFTAQREVALAIFERQLRRDEAKPQAILLQSGSFPELEALAEAKGVPVVTEVAALNALGVRPPRVLAHGELAYDLRRNPQLARARLQAAVGAWRWPLLVGAVAAGIWAAAALVEISRREAQIASLRSQSEALVRRHFVAEAPLLDMRVQVAQALSERVSAGAAAREGDETALDYFADAAAVIADGNIKLISAVGPTPDELVLFVELPDFAAADTLVEDMRGVGLLVDVVETRVTDEAAWVRSELRVTRTTIVSGAGE